MAAASRASNVSNIKRTQVPMRSHSMVGSSSAGKKLELIEKVTSEEFRLIDITKNNERFKASASSTVLNKRDAGKIFGKSKKNVRDVLKGDDDQQPNVDILSSEDDDSDDSDDEGDVEQIRPTWKMPCPGNDKCATRWNWPLPYEPKLRNEMETFEVEMVIFPYSAEDIWIQAIGTDLVMRFEKEGEDKRPIWRTYQLPVNVDPRSIKFQLSKSARVMRISADKISPIKFMAAAYGKLPDKNNEEEAEGEGDNSFDTSEMGSEVSTS